ncbi:MAG: nucleotidyltransferase [Sphingobacteriales bacterium]|nr:MAG: nucleotidyltransferase [Sphingobacteriales bacterium]
MNIIIPMAGMGKRMRPHTLTTPKPLIAVGGKPIVQRLVEDIAEMCADDIHEIAFVVGHFGEEVEKNLLAIAQSVGAKGKIFYQDEALGTAHAILCARECLTENVIVAFADTLFYADFKIDKSKDGIIWVHRIPDPSAFGVVVLDENKVVKEFVEKSPTFISDLAIIGIYYFRDGVNLEKELQYLIDKNIRIKGEYQITDALENMKNKGMKLVTAEVKEWLDCGNKDATVYTNQRVLELTKHKQLVAASAVMENAVIIPPCFIGEKVAIKNSVVGPYVSIGAGSRIENSRVENSIIQNQTQIRYRVINNSMIGSNASIESKPSDLSLGDYSTES